MKYTTWRTLSLLIVSSLMASCASAHTPAEAMAEAAHNLLASLDAQQREMVEFPFDGDERKNWNFVPMERAGLPLKKMKTNQQQLGFALLNSALSHRGYSKAMGIMALEQILHEMEDNSPRRDPSLYHFYIFGSPSTAETWGWRVEGHHLSVNITLVGGQQPSVTPSFWGANPGNVKQGPQKGLRVLKPEEDLARSLLKSLDDKKREVAVILAEAPADVINGPGREATPLEPQGLSAEQMTGKQRKVLMSIVREYVNNFRPELAKQDLKKIRAAGVQKIHFAWAGGSEIGQPHYYRIQGPTFIMEYDNTQNDANHIHVVWRDFENDFGADLLKQHYEKVSHKNK